jgi:hypothetical protein
MRKQNHRNREKKERENKTETKTEEQLSPLTFLLGGGFFRLLCRADGGNENVLKRRKRNFVFFSVNYRID